MPGPPRVLCGSLSLHPVSLGAAMHRAGYAALGLDYDYVPFKVTDLEGALTGMRALGIRGFGVSMPYKVEVIPLLDELQPLARRIGAVNTIVNDEGRLTGHNTDAVGAVRALREHVELEGKRVAVIGAGGAARAVVCGLVDAGARVHVANRTPTRARALCDELGASSWDALSALTDLGDYDVLVNASRAGMQPYGASSPVPPERLSASLLVMDIVYHPVETELLRQARARGATAIHGGKMLLYQAAQQFELYTGHAAPLAAMEAALQTQLDGLAG